MKISRKICDGRGEIVSSSIDSKSVLLPAYSYQSTRASCLLWAPIVRVRGKTSDEAFTIQTAAKHNLDHYRLGVNCERLLATSRQQRSSVVGGRHSRIWLWLQQCIQHSSLRTLDRAATQLAYCYTLTDYRTGMAGSQLTLFTLCFSSIL